MNNILPLIVIVFIFIFFSAIGKILTAVFKRVLSGQTLSGQTLSGQIGKETKSKSKTGSSIGVKIREALAQIQKELETAKNKQTTEAVKEPIAAEWEKVGYKRSSLPPAEAKKRQKKREQLVSAKVPKIAEKNFSVSQKSAHQKRFREKHSEKRCSFPYANSNINRLRRAFVWSEILGPPLALREKDRKDINSLPSDA